MKPSFSYGFPMVHGLKTLPHSIVYVKISTGKPRQLLVFVDFANLMAAMVQSIFDNEMRCVTQETDADPGDVTA